MSSRSTFAAIFCFASGLWLASLFWVFHRNSGTSDSLTAFLDLRTSIAVTTALAIVALLAWLMSLDDTNKTGKRTTIASGGKPTHQAAIDVDVVRIQLEQQLAQLLALVGGQIASSDRQSKSLGEANDAIAAATSIDQIRGVVENLVARNLANQQEAAQMRSELEQAQSQTVAMRERMTRAEQLSNRDALTSVLNRRGFDDTFADSVAKSHADGMPLCVILADIDHFKKVNDTFGHPTGDHVLKSLAELMTKSVRPTDVVARYGGEEFAIVLPRTALGNAFTVAERVRKSLQKAKLKDENDARPLGQLTASFGVAEIQDGDTPTSILKRADLKLYEAKRKGRNRTEIYGTAEV